MDDLIFAENFTCSDYSSSSLQADLDDFTKWSKDDLLRLNPVKCQALQIYFGKSHLSSKLRIGSDPLSHVTEAKVLGVYLQNDPKWNTQINNMIMKANRRSFMLRTLKHVGFDKEELCVVYSGYVRLILEYADVVWHSSISAKQINDIESMQKRACRIILGNSYERREDHCRKFAVGLSNNERTKSLLPPSRFERSLRNKNNVSFPKLLAEPNVSKIALSHILSIF